MFLFWLIFGMIILLTGIFDRQILHLLHIKQKSEVILSPKLKKATRLIENLARGLIITLGVSLCVQGLGNLLPADLSRIMTYSLLGISAALLLLIFGVSFANWKPH